MKADFKPKTKEELHGYTAGGCFLVIIKLAIAAVIAWKCFQLPEPGNYIVFLLLLLWLKP